MVGFHLFAYENCGKTTQCNQTSEIRAPNVAETISEILCLIDVEISEHRD